MSCLTPFARACADLGHTPDGIPDKESPFIQEGGKVYLRFDGLRLAHSPAGTMITYLWWGHDCYMDLADGPSAMLNGASVTINGVEGRIQMRVDRNPS